ncbi:hypothetical protein ALC60_05095 [Trachymyrmex zeteki]|uniref:Uncharacterized protein n=1 Tax=Mycetomoellerius zeteki TaxID=64791 RepID=A0A151X6H2_9HYME|nr:hypothetical protein ALC60_05095 [Trachymyrmex zeteki]
MPNTRKSEGHRRPNRPVKKKFNYNPEKMENEKDFVSTSAKKMKDTSYDDIEIDIGRNNVILDFLTVFTFLSQCLKCKECDSDVRFTRTCERGLGFRLVIKCMCKKENCVSSSPLINTAYEINRRLMFVMQMLGLGLHSINIFCSLMELSAGFANNTYYTFLDNLLNAARSTFIQCKAVAEEKEQNMKAGNTETHLKAEGRLANFHHVPPLSESVQTAIRPVYEALSNDDLLQRCTGGNTQNDNESFNACVWKQAPKHLHCGVQTIEISAYIAAGIFNEGYSSVLKTMSTLGINIGPNSRHLAEKIDSKRMEAAEANMSEFAKKARIEKLFMQVQQNRMFEEEEGIMYGAGIAD